MGSNVLFIYVDTSRLQGRLKKGIICRYLFRLSSLIIYVHTPIEARGVSLCLLTRNSYLIVLIPHRLRPPFNRYLRHLRPFPNLWPTSPSLLIVPSWFDLSSSADFGSLPT